MLRVPLGPVLDRWPAGLVLHAELHGDLVADARLTWLGSPGTERAADDADPTPGVLDAVSDVLGLAGDDRRGRQVRALRGRVLERGTPEVRDGSTRSAGPSAGACSAGAWRAPRPSSPQRWPACSRGSAPSRWTTRPAATGWSGATSARCGCCWPRWRRACAGRWPVPELLLALAAAVGLGALLVVLGLASSVTRTATGGEPVGTAWRAPACDVARLLRQRRRRTVATDLVLLGTASLALVPTALILLALVPYGDHVLLASSVGLVWVNALDVLVWAWVWLLGWGPNSVAGLVGGYRFLALALAYELPLMFALVAPAIAAGSLDLAVIASGQTVWYAVWMPVAFAAYCIGVLGFSLRGPLSSPAGADLSGGVLAELSGPDALLVRVGRHALLGAGAALAVPLFLGGGSGPLLPGVVWVLLKALALTVGLAWVAARLPSVRPHRLMEPAWVVLLPLVLVQDLVVAVVAVGTR